MAEILGVQTLNRAKYGGLDFDTHFDDLRSRMQLRFAADFNDFALSSLGIMLVDVVSFGLDTMSFYLDRRATDNYLDTARTRASVAKLTRQLGYKMRAAVASSVDLNVAIAVPVAFAVTVPKGFQFNGPNSLIFEAAQSTSFAAGSSSTDIQSVPCYEGTTLIESFVSTGTANQIFELRKVVDPRFIVNGSVEVRVNGAVWTESEFISFDQTDQYEIGYNDKPPTLAFGDGVAGNVPPIGASIVIKYVTSRGKTGQVAEGSITSEKQPLVVNFTTIKLSITNPEPSVGGDDPETLTHAKAFAGKVFNSRQVAVTTADYDALAGSYADPLYGRVAVAKAISARSSAGDAEIQNQLTTIRNTASAPSDAVTAEGATVNAAVATATDELDTLGTALSTAAGYSTDADTALSSAVDSARAAKNQSLEVSTDSADITGYTISGTTLLMDDAQIAVNDAGPNQLTSVMKARLKTYFDLIASEAGTILTAITSIQTSLDAEIASMGTARNKLTDIGLAVTTLESQLLVAETARVAVGVQLPLITSSMAAIQTAVGDTTSITDAACTAISDHVDALLASDCQANLVSVPILVRDASGFYAAPSLSLIKSLQDYLDSRKEVTQTVKVTSGENSLVKAVLTVKIAYLDGYSPTVIQATAKQVVDTVLKDRPFGRGLFTSEIIDQLMTIVGAAFVNVKIDGYLDTNGVTVLTDKVDGDGDLVIGNTEIVTKGIVTVELPFLATDYIS